MKTIGITNPETGDEDVLLKFNSEGCINEINVWSLFVDDYVELDLNEFIKDQPKFYEQFQGKVDEYLKAEIDSRRGERLEEE